MGKMTRATAALLSCLVLIACAEGPRREGPFAPGTAREGTEVDQMLVAQRLMAAGEFELAINAYSRAALKEGMSAEVLAGIATANLKLGRLETAERLLRRALDKDERAPEIWNNLGVVLMEKGKTAEAVEVFRRAYALDNGESDAIRDNLRLSLEKFEKPGYGATQGSNYKLVRRGSSDYLIRKIP